MDGDLQVQVPADINAPDRVLYGLTARQVAILAATGAVLWMIYHAVTPTVPPVAVAIAAVPVVALAAGLALGRRDGIGMDRWVAAALLAARAPRVLVASGTLAAAPDWAPMTHATDPAGRTSAGYGHAQSATAHKTSRRNSGTANAKGRADRTTDPRLAPLRLPAEHINPGGVVDLGAHGRVALTAVSTVNFDLRSPDEQHALIEAAGRWLNSLSTPTQIVVSTRRVDMDAHADVVEQNLEYLPHPALADAAAGYAQFLRQLGDERDPLDRHIVVAHRVGPHADAGVARRHAEHTARALSGLGTSTQVLDGGAVTDVLAAACNPWQNTGFGRATPDATVTGPVSESYETELS